MATVLDASALLTFLLDEPGKDAIALFRRSQF